MARRSSLKNVLSKGELGPKLRERLDLTHYYLGLKRAENIVIMPEGGATRRGGTWTRLPRVRREIEPIHLTAAMLTVHNGGTKANAIDQDPATELVTNTIGAAEFVVLEIDLGVTTEVCFVDVQEFGCSAERADDALAVEYWDGAAWRPAPGADDPVLSPRRNIRQSRHTRRFGGRPGIVMAARQWRIVVYNGTALGTFALKGIAFWAETARPSAMRIVSFARSREECNQAIVTDRNIDFADGAIWLGAIPLDADGDLVPLLNFEQSQDTMFAFHEDVAMPRIQRQGAPDEWDTADATATFENLPKLAKVVKFGGARNEVQELQFPDVVDGQIITLRLGGQLAAPVTFTTAGALPGSIAAAIGALPGVNAGGVTASLVALTSGPLVRIEMSGLNGNRRWPRIVASIAGVGRAGTRIVQDGLPEVDDVPASSTPPIIGPTTGYPRCGAIYQGRLILGGLRAAPQTLLFSRAGNIGDWKDKSDPMTADLGFRRSLDTDQLEVIREIQIGQHLQVFTDSGEWWSDNRTLDATGPVNMILATRHGVAANVPLVHADGATLFVQSGDASNPHGRTLRDYQFVADERASYQAEPLSLLAPHLLTGVVDMAYRPAASTSEGNLVLLVNADGTLAIMTLLRKQEVTALVRAPVDGRVKAVMVDPLRRIWLGVERNGDTSIEQWQDGLTLDAAVGSTGTVIQSLGGLGHLEGKAVWAWIDGNLAGPLTVTDAAIALPFPGSDVRAGLPVLARLRTLPLRERLQNEQPFRPPARVYEVELSLLETGPVWLIANDGDALEMPVLRLDGLPLPGEGTGEEVAALADASLMDRLLSGESVVDGLEGWTTHAEIELFQTVPAPFTLRSIRYEISY